MKNCNQFIKRSIIFTFMTCIETKVAFDITVHFNLLKVESKAEKFDVGIKYAKIPFLLQLFPNMN